MPRRAANRHSSTWYSRWSMFNASPDSCLNQWSSPAQMTETPSGRIIIAPGPNGEMSCPRRTGPLGIVTLLQHVELGDLGLALGVYVAERLRCRPRHARPV